MALKDKEFWSNIDLIGHLGRFFGGITSKEYEDATDKTNYKRKVPLDDGTWKSVEDLGNSKETLTQEEITSDSTQLSPAKQTDKGTSYTLHELFVKIFGNIKYLFSWATPYTTTLTGQSTSSNADARTIKATQHGKGTNPSVYVLYNGDVVRAGIKINASGDVTIEWAETLVFTSSSPLTVIIK